jgi:aspartyl-tRNA(Asn)/glutamyl-tRNA(Gln) amidotransferase subunit A
VVDESLTRLDSALRNRLVDLGVVEAGTAIRRREISSEALVSACLSWIRASDGEIRAWSYVDKDAALAEARRRDDEIGMRGRRGHLYGVPIGVKDIVDVAGMPTSAGAKAFAHTWPARDATLVARLREAGAVIVGKTVSTEFAFKDPAATTNPWSLEHSPGGSSSGSAAAVAARHIPAAIGTQTVGSLLRPAAFCGLVGLKGTYGRVPLAGVRPLAWSLDHAGVLARSVADAAAVERVIEGKRLDNTPLSKPRFAIVESLFDLAEPYARRRLIETVRSIEAAGAELIDFALPIPVDEIVDATQIILQSEAAAFHRAAFAEHRAEYGPAIAELITAGLATDAAAYARAERVRGSFRRAAMSILRDVDALLSPVAPSGAPPRSAGTGDYRLCAPWSLIGVPSVSIPASVDSIGLPLGLQLTGAPNRVSRLIGAAAWTERVISFSHRPAGVFASDARPHESAPRI